MKLHTLFFLAISALLFACNDDTTPDPTPINNNNNGNGNGNGNTPVAAISYDSLVFTKDKAYFATGTSMTAPVKSFQIGADSNNIDITYIFNYDYDGPGFFDPVARSQDWYWDEYYAPFLSGAIETRFYKTNLTKAQFDAAKADESKIAVYFADAANVTMVPHGIFPTGSCFGGRVSSNPVSITPYEGNVFGFKNTVSGKKGLMYIRTDQIDYWHEGFFGTETKVDLVKEH